MIKTRTWIILIGMILLFSAAAVILLQPDNSGSGTAARIYLDGECIYTIDLADTDIPYSIPVTGEYGTNVISVEKGRICVSEADCPDQVCVNQGWRSGGITPIVCLPNKLVIQLEESPVTDQAEMDGVVQ